MINLSRKPCLAAAILLATAALHAKKPPESGELYNFQGTLSLSDIKLEKGAAVSVGQMGEGRPAIKVDFTPSDNKYPGINFPVPSEGWDLSGYSGVQVEVNNPGTSQITVYLRVDNDGDWSKNPYSTEILQVEAGKTKTLKAEFGKAFGQPGYKLDPAKVTGLKFFTNPPSVPVTVYLTNLKADKGSAGGTAAAAPAAAGPAISEGSSKPYITKTTSPKDHSQPYGQSWELVKDWTFGKNRADATVRNRADLDREFYYRYIYNEGKLDTLSTYWTVHRDYPDDDPKNLHVFGDDTLTLKARVREGMSLKKGGLESGMLRAKFPVTPGMYIEMRAKLTTGIGAWPAFWLGAGVQKDDGTFSELPWPPEIDIFEFFNWQGRPQTRQMSGNIQTNKKPEKFGNPYMIFTAMNKDREYVPGFDFSEDFHVFALDWQENRPIWILDGHPIKQQYYEWNGPPAHILVTNQLGIEFGDMKDMKVGDSNWDYVVDYIRVWKRKE